jgi:hypothetical protein
MIDQTADDLWQRARALMGAGNEIAARTVLESLVQHRPRHSAAQMTLGHIAWAGDRVRDASRHTLAAAADAPPDAMSIIAVAVALVRVGETVAARNILEHAALVGTQQGTALVCHAGVRRDLGEDARALQLLDRAHALGIDGAEFRFARGLEHVICGHPREAGHDFEASLRMDPASCVAALELARLRTQTADSNHLDEFDRRLRRVAHGTQDHAALEFARYKELEDIGRHEDAWDALASANAIMRVLHPVDPEQMRQQVDRLIGQTANHASGSAAPGEGPQPIFIIGLPRSGTTLLDRLLGSHSRVTSAGELEDFARQLCWSADQRALLDERMLRRLPELDYPQIGRRYLAQTQWRAAGADWYIDKQPWNYMLAGLIHKALPQARLLHLVREPMDVCFSNFRAMLGARYACSFDLRALARQHVEYQRLMAHWHALMSGSILDVSYGELVGDTAATMRKVLAFCGLDWEPGCTDPSRNRASVGTLSAVQSRAGIKGVFGAWRRYERQLATFQAML